MEKGFKLLAQIVIAAACTVVLCSNTGYAQSEERSNWLPIDCLDDTLYVQKYEPYTSYEIGQSINGLLSHANDKEDSLMVQDMLLSGAEFFNLILYRKINNIIDEVIESRRDLPLIAVHKTDLKENINSNYRYVIRSSFTMESFESPEKYRYGYHIYDIQNDVQYRNYPTLIMLIEALTYSRQLKNRDNALSQNSLDNKLTDKALQPVKRKQSAGRVLFWVGFAALVLLASIF